MTINSRGLRDREYPYEKPQGVSRVACHRHGRLVRLGYGVADDEVFAEVLERRLREAEGKWEVLNTGVSGWGTDQEYLYLKQEGFRYSPDIVVLALSLVNDPLDAATSRQYGLDKPVFVNTDLMKLANVPVPYVDLDDHFDARSIPREKFGESSPLEGHDGVHWNAYGHRVAAEELCHFL